MMVRLHFEAPLLDSSTVRHYLQSMTYKPTDKELLLYSNVVQLLEERDMWRHLAQERAASIVRLVNERSELIKAIESVLSETKANILDTLKGTNV